MAPNQPTTFPTPRARAVSNSIDSATAVARRCEERLDTARLQVLRADAVVRRVRVYLEGYDQRYDSTGAYPFAAENVTRRRR